MSHKIAMAREGTQFTGMADAERVVSISWPFGGIREVIEVEKLDAQIKERVGAGFLEIMPGDAEVTEPHEPEDRGNLLLTGDEAKELMAQPAAPVFTEAHDPETGETIQKEIQTPAVPDTSHEESVKIAEDTAAANQDKIAEQKSTRARGSSGRYESPKSESKE